MSESPELEIKERRLPHWKHPGSVYFITFRLHTGSLSNAERQTVLEHIKSGQDRFYILLTAVVMPDHVHLILKPKPGIDLSKIMQGIKGVSARKLNTHRGTSGTIWQDESYDRIIRDDREFMKKLEYIQNNPMKAELVKRIEDYDTWFINHEACFGPNKLIQ